MPSAQPVALIYNPMAGSRPRLRRARTVEEVAAALRAHGAEPELLPTRGPGDGMTRGREAAAAFPLIAALGGDGTVNEVLNGMVAAGASARLLVLPGGSVNVLARDLRISLDPCRAAALVREGIERRLFLGRAGQRYFAFVASSGVDASIVWRLGRGPLKRTLGPLAFMMEGLRHSVAYDFPRLTVRSGDREIQGFLAVVGNSPGYAGWFSITPGANPAERGFEVAVCTSRFAPKYFYYLGLALAGRLPRCADFIYVKTDRVRIWADGPAYVQVDGEPHDMLPMDFCHDGAWLPFVVPAR